MLIYGLLKYSFISGFLKKFDEKVESRCPPPSSTLNRVKFAENLIKKSAYQEIFRGSVIITKQEKFGVFPK